MLENFKNTISDVYNDFVIDRYDAQNFESSMPVDGLYEFSEEQILIADCVPNGKSGYWCYWNSDARLTSL